MHDLTPEQIHILQHSLGLSKRHDKPYRNYYAVYTGSRDVIQDLESLVEKGLMANGGKSPVNADMIYFYVTEKGRQVAIENLPGDKRSPGQKRYERFLNLKDVCPDLTFKQFLTDKRWNTGNGGINERTRISQDDETTAQRQESSDECSLEVPGH